MKKLALILALMLVQTQVLATAVDNANTDKRPAQQQVRTVQPQAAQTQSPSQVQKDEEYLLKYNIRDLEAAPWLHGGQRSYN